MQLSNTGKLVREACNKKIRTAVTITGRVYVGPVALDEVLQFNSLASLAYWF